MERQKRIDLGICLCIKPQASTRSSHYSTVSETSGLDVSMWTCTKLCALCFVAGMAFSFYVSHSPSMRQRRKEWAKTILKFLADDNED